MKLSKNNFITSTKICSALLFIFLVEYGFLGIYPALLGALAGLHCYFVNSKGFYKKRILTRSIKILICSNIALLLKYITMQNEAYCLITTFLFTAIIVFFSFDEHMKGFMNHRPILFIFVYSIYSKTSPNAKDIIAVSLAVIIACIITMLMHNLDLNKNMKKSIEDYIEKCIKEVRSHKENLDVEKAQTDSYEAYKNFLSEFYKSSYRWLLSSSYGKLLFEFALYLHNFMENIRFTIKYKNITDEKYDELEKFLIALKKGETPKFKFVKTTEKLAHILLEKRKSICDITDESSEKKYTHHNEHFTSWLKDNINFNTLRMKYTLKVAITLTIGVFVSFHYFMGKPIWIPITMLPLLLPSKNSTNSTTFNRIIGTFLGVAITFIILPLIPNLYGQIFLAILGLFGAFVMLGIHYIGVITFITITAIIINLPAASTTTLYFQRALYTVAAGLIVVIMEWIFSDRHNKTIKKTLIQIIENDILIIKGIRTLHKTKKEYHIDDFIMKAYLYRDLIHPRFQHSEISKERKLIKISIIFIETLTFLYSREKNGYITTPYDTELLLIEDILNKYILMLKGEKVVFPKKEELKALQDKVSEISVHTLLGLVICCVDEVN